MGGISPMTNDNLINRFSKIERDNIALIKRFFKEVWNDRRIETIQEFASPDVVAHYEHDEIKGINSWKEMIYEVVVKAIPDFRIEIEDIIANGDYVATRWNGQGVHKGELFGVLPSGEKIEFSGMSWMRMVDGKVVENWNNTGMSYLFWQLLEEIKTLREILPLCSFCKKIRDDKGYWEQVDVYLHKYSEADISHSVCPDCAKEHYPDLDIYE
jgi:predicted ester cyclase